jgi:arginine repressor
MDESDRQWVQQRLEALAGLIGEEVGKTQTEIVRKLREEIGQLRASISLLEALKAAKPDVAIEGVVPMQRSRHVA